MGDGENWAHLHMSKYSEHIFSWIAPFQIFYPILPIYQQNTQNIPICLWYVYIFRKEHVYSQNLVISQNCFGSEIKAESFLPLQYNINSKCRVPQTEHYIEKLEDGIQSDDLLPRFVLDISG